MPLPPATKARIDGLAAALLPEHVVRRAKRTDLAITDDGMARADRMTGELPRNVWPAYDLTQIIAPEGTDFNDLEEYLNALEAGVAPASATYIVQTADATLTNEQALGALATGLLKSTTTTGVLSIATANTDYLPVASPTTTGTFTSTGDSALGNSDGDITTVWGHLRHKSGAPSIAVGVALGTGGSVGATVTWGSDQVGLIALVAGTTSLTTGTAATITFSAARPDTHYSITLSPASSNARQNTVQAGPVNGLAGAWTVFFTTAPASGGTYNYFYTIVEAA